ncbi:MAG: hypothetical protein AAGF33_14630 [Pseudomonadota bacterium]
MFFVFSAHCRVNEHRNFFYPRELFFERQTLIANFNHLVFDLVPRYPRFNGFDAAFSRALKLGDFLAAQRRLGVSFSPKSVQGFRVLNTKQIKQFLLKQVGFDCLKN